MDEMKIELREKDLENISSGMQTSIKCPKCGHQIVILAEELIQGKSFECMNPDCDAIISLILQEEGCLRYEGYCTTDSMAELLASYDYFVFDLDGTLIDIRIDEWADATWVKFCEYLDDRRIKPYSS